MKILAVYTGEGSKYHRVKLPLFFFKDHEIIFTDGLDEFLVEDIDVLWIHWNSKVQPIYLSLFREKYKFKIILDIDDSWDIPLNHVSPNVGLSVKLSREYAKIADWVIVSNPRLAKEVEQVNLNIKIIPNHIPYGYDQFKLVTESRENFMNRRIKVGFFGGHNHYNDWMEIQGQINTLVKNPLFKEQADFYLCGYSPTNAWWNKLKTKFPYAKLIQGSKVENYMPVYDLDISLCPLEDNHFNRCKSDLKILEAAARKAICVVDPIYKELSIHSDTYFVAESSKDWYKIPLDLISDKERLYDLKENSSQLVLKTEHINSLFAAVPYIDLAVKPRMELMSQEPYRFSDYSIWSIAYKPDQICEYTPYLNPIKTVEEKSYLFEYNPILKLIPNATGKYVGCFSWKFNQKTGITKYELERVLEKTDADVISFCFKIPTYLKFSNKHHPGFIERFTLLCKELGLTCREPQFSVYSNFFVAKPEVYSEYVELLTKAIRLLEDEKYKAFANSNYKSGLDSETLYEHTGLRHYTWHTFLLERLMSIWIDNKKLKVKVYNNDIFHRKTQL